MSDEYVSEVRLPVSYQNTPENKLLLDADKYVHIRLRAKGGDIFSSKFFSSHEALNINLQQAEIRKSRYFDRYYILTDQFRNQFSNRFDFAHSVLSVHPDTLFLNFEEVVNRNIPVKSEVTISCKSRFQLYDSIQLIPNMIKVSGPASVIDTLKYIATEKKAFTDLDKNLEATVKISSALLASKLRFNHTEIKLQAMIEEFTESVIQLPVTAYADDTSAMVKTFPETVALTYKVALKDFTRVRADMFSLSVSYTQEKDMNKNFLKVQVDNKPDFIQLTRIQPEKLEFLIQK